MITGYGVIFESLFTGSMFGAGPTRFAVWTYILARHRDGLVELNPALLAATLGTTKEDAQDAIDYLCAPDTSSRTPDHDGRRLMHVEGMTYGIVNWPKYKEMLNAERRRQQVAEAQRKVRDKRRGVMTDDDASSSVMTVDDKSSSVSPSTSTSTSTARTTTTDISPAVAVERSPNWVDAAVRVWAQHVGVVTHGEMGKRLKPAVAAYGEEIVLVAMERFCRFRARRQLAGEEYIPGLPAFVRDLRAHIPRNLLPEVA